MVALVEHPHARRETSAGTTTREIRSSSSRESSENSGTRDSSSIGSADAHRLLPHASIIPPRRRASSRRSGLTAGTSRWSGWRRPGRADRTGAPQRGHGCPAAPVDLARLGARARALAAISPAASPTTRSSSLAVQLGRAAAMGRSVPRSTPRSCRCFPIPAMTRWSRSTSPTLSVWSRGPEGRDAARGLEAGRRGGRGPACVRSADRFAARASLRRCQPHAAELLPPRRSPSTATIQAPPARVRATGSAARGSTSGPRIPRWLVQGHAGPEK